MARGEEWEPSYIADRNVVGTASEENREFTQKLNTDIFKMNKSIETGSTHKMVGCLCLGARKFWGKSGVTTNQRNHRVSLCGKEGNKMLYLVIVILVC